MSTTPASTAKPFTVARDYFSLNAAASCQPHQRNKLERLCRYVARPPLSLALALERNRSLTKANYAMNSNNLTLTAQPISYSSSEPEPAEPTQLTWAQRLKRAFEFDVTACPLCSRTLRVIADITDPAFIDKIITHIRQSRAPPAQAQKRANG